MFLHQNVFKLQLQLLTIGFWKKNWEVRKILSSRINSNCSCNWKIYKNAFACFLFDNLVRADEFSKVRSKLFSKMISWLQDLITNYKFHFATFYWLWTCPKHYRLFQNRRKHFLSFFLVFFWLLLWDLGFRTYSRFKLSSY